MVQRDMFSDTLLDVERPARHVDAHHKPLSASLDRVPNQAEHPIAPWSAGGFGFSSDALSSVVNKRGKSMKKDLIEKETARRVMLRSALVLGAALIVQPNGGAMAMEE